VYETMCMLCTVQNTTVFSVNGYNLLLSLLAYLHTIHQGGIQYSCKCIRLFATAWVVMTHQFTITFKIIPACREDTNASMLCYKYKRVAILISHMTWVIHLLSDNYLHFIILCNPYSLPYNKGIYTVHVIILLNFVHRRNLE